jgi:hypothetical protein
MIGYPFIEAFFKNVLKKSKAINGRFFICPRGGQEINTGDLDQVIQDLVFPATIDKKFPLVLMMPPVSEGSFTFKKQEWKRLRCVLLFLNTTYYTGTNQVKNPNKNTGTSQHTIVQDWHDMERCATSFLRVVSKLERSLNLINTYLRLEQDADKRITPVSNIGVDRASGVMCEFYVHLFEGCDIEDYDPDDIDEIEVPAEDSHPEHKL